ncbi:EscU/YscU/HrcU family type III secretion system export apparatus switch protein [Ramlibacter tataouinensis]|uniref:EscU/YscU/HrcU family type III secretion system export apparatus switch protein n=1 Tax=Ramlibacter tataouinensis TaxID=94132 RepID=UPI0022F404C9|nr:EscU/YscU/HrcU family type III secretion system export apparatus switch protein [Ramlibacter tataouinensis]WBY00626.1 EscU/YscU/HrcU family type III secretion system export apparatus switch protein [Ramlibacter tataouinensis]
MTPRTQAVALSYADKGSAPKVVAKGYGATAEAIVQSARDSGVYVHGSVELVQLLMGVELDRHIPPALYVAVAELLVWLYETDCAAASASSSVGKPQIP